MHATIPTDIARKTPPPPPPPPMREYHGTKNVPRDLAVATAAVEAKRNPLPPGRAPLPKPERLAATTLAREPAPGDADTAAANAMLPRVDKDCEPLMV
mmetsp:Transcript_31851/g.80097  ORF Transcript_31851/g.80097 Transcript_31851/m.80097 type:complete len:98 (-) Transcript_31851:407-700(-)